MSDRLQYQTGRGGSRGLRASHEGRDAFVDDYGTLLSSVEDLASGAVAVQVDLAPYETVLTTGGTAGSEDVTVGDGTADLSAGLKAARVGQRKLVTLGTRTNASDVVNLDHANMANAAGTDATNVDLDAEGEFVLLEWNGTKWQVVYANATIAP